MNRIKEKDKKSEIIEIKGKKFRVIWNKAKLVKEPCPTCGRGKNVAMSTGKIVELKK